ncbi:hypothetical protein [Microbispora sp. NPDC046933]|uniref:hypothetical protein n=1 Tax=Microbispora sp. NPDC046933 TaxID=3155618 RepID=UPI0033D3CF67
MAEVRDGCERHLYMLVSSAYEPGSGLAPLDLEQEVTDVRAAFETLGYPRHRHRINRDPSARDAQDDFREWLATKGPDDVLAVYVTGHGGFKELADGGGRRFYAYTVDSDRARPSTALTMADLLRSLADLDAQDRFRNLFLVLDMCGAGAGLKTAVEEIRAHLPAHFLEAGERTGTHIVATARAEDLAGVRVFASAFRQVVQAWDVADRTTPYLELGVLVERMREHLTDQVMEMVTVGQVGGNLCLPNPRHHLAGIDPVEMDGWWAPLAQGTPTTGGVSQPFRSGRRWLFTGRRKVNRRLARWLRNPNDVPVLVLTASPGSGKSTVVARTVALTAPDFRRMHDSEAGEAPEDQRPPDGFTFADAIWARRRSVPELETRVRRALRLDAGQPLADLYYRSPEQDPPVIAFDAVDEADEPHRLAREVIGPLAQAAQRGVVRLLVATRRQPVDFHAGEGAEGRARRDDLLPPILAAGDHELVDLDDLNGGWLARGDMAAYVGLLLADPVNDNGQRNPYATDEQARRRLAWAIEQQARNIFLLAGLVARKHTNDRAVVDPTTAAWRNGFPRTIGEAFTAELEAAFGQGGFHRIHSLMRPLAYAQGAGLPREHVTDGDLWAYLATRLNDEGERYTAEDVDALLAHRISTHLIGMLDPHGEPVYRFHHDALARHFTSPPAEAVARHRQTAAALTGTLDTPEGRDWSRAGRYLRRSLPAHAALGGVLPDLAHDPGLFAECDPEPLHAALGSSPELRPLQRVLRPVLHRLPDLGPPGRAFLIGLLARSRGSLRPLADLLERFSGAPVTCVTAAFRIRDDHLVMFDRDVWVNAVATARDHTGEPLGLTASGPILEAWDPADGTLLNALPGHADMISALTLFTDHAGFPALASADLGGTALTWDLILRGHPISRWPVPRGLTCLAAGRISRDRPFLAAASQTEIAVWEPAIDAHRGVRTHEPPGFPVTSIAVVAGPHESDLVGVAAGDTVRIWDAASGLHVTDLPFPGALNLRVQGGRGYLLITHGMTEGHCVLWDAAGGVLRALPGDDVLTCAEFGEDERGRPYLAGGYLHGSVRLWDPATGTLTATLLDEGPTINEVVVTSQGVPLVAALDALGVIHVWEAGTGRRTAVLPDAQNVRPLLGPAMAFGRHRDGEAYLLTGGARQARIWDLSAAEHELAEHTHRGPVAGLTVVRLAGGAHVVTAGKDATIRVWNPVKAALRGQPLPAVPDETAELVTWSGPHLAYASEEGVRILDLEAGVQRRFIQGESPIAGATSRTGRRLLAVVRDGAVRVHTPVTPPSPEEDGFSLSPAEVAGVGDGEALTDAPSGHAKTVSGKRFPCRMNPAVPSLDLMDDDPPFTLTGPASRIIRLHFGRMSDGGLFLVAGTDRLVPQGTVTTAWLWPCEPVGPGIELPGHAGAITTLASGDEACPFVATGSRGGTLRCWDPGSGELRHDLSRGTDEWIIGLAGGRLRDGTPLLASLHLARGVADLCLWNPVTGQLLHTIHHAGGNLSRLRFGITQGGDPFLCCLHDETLEIVWPGPPLLRAQVPLPSSPRGMAVDRDTVYLECNGGVLGLKVEPGYGVRTAPHGGEGPC